MSKHGEDFIGLVPKADKRPKSAMVRGRYGTAALIRDQLTISTWLSLGAVAQGVLFLAVGRLALIPAVAIILFRTLKAYAMTTGWIRDPYMDDVIRNKISAQFPDAAGNYGGVPANDEVVVFLLGTRSNHPLGVLAPGFKEFGSYFPTMLKDMEDKPEEYGFLGVTSWLNMGDRATGSEVMTVYYFRSIDGLHKFAHSPSHREGWNWWSKHAKQYPHIAIWHETYHVPKGHWESIAANSHATGINSTTFKVVDKESGKESWASPIVDASKGLLKTGAGRMSRSQADEHDKYEQSAY